MYPLYDVIVGGGSPRHESSLFIVRVRTLRLGNGLVIAIFSNVLPKVQRSRSLSPDNVAKWRQGTKVTLAPDAPLSYYSVHSQPQCGRRAADALRMTHWGRRIGVISAITCQIGRMRPTLRPTHGQRIAADYERHNVFLVFITNAADVRPTHYAAHSRPQCVGSASAAMRLTDLLLSAEMYKHLVIECTVERLAPRLNGGNSGNIEYSYIGMSTKHSAWEYSYTGMSVRWEKKLGGGPMKNEKL